MITEILAVLLQLNKIIAGFPVTIFETIMVSLTPCCFDYMGEKAEVITKGKQSIFMNIMLPLVIQISKYPSVLPQ